MPAKKKTARKPARTSKSSAKPKKAAARPKPKTPSGMPAGVKAKDFLRVSDFSTAEIRATLDWALAWKKGKVAPRPLIDQTVGCIFHKPSLRTRQSFEAGIVRFGGHPMFITDREIELGVRETIADVARVMSRYLAMIIIRTFKQSDVEELARYATVPVINALTDASHPCQIMADILTAREHLGRIDNLSVAFLGDGNNVFNSWVELAARIPMDLRLATSPQTLPDMALVEMARKEGHSKITITHEAREAVAGADVVYTDVWASMGQKDLAYERERLLRPFQVNTDLMKHAKATAIVMHCLPAERGREITAEVLDSKQAVVFDEAENRMWAQGAIMAQLLARR
ncbi:MAG TPA: ornithine carbamoyltransferase [bacterium]|nr:ornithine carbamoyltransferase [bacterium]